MENESFFAMTTCIFVFFSVIDVEMENVCLSVYFVIIMMIVQTVQMRIAVR